MPAKANEEPKHLGLERQVVIGAQSNDHTARLARVPMDRFFTDADIFVGAQLLVTQYYNFDAVSNFWDVYNIEAEALGQNVVYHSGGIPDVDRRRYLIKDYSDLDHLRPPNPLTSGRMPWVFKINRKFLDSTGKLDRAYFTAPFSLAVNIRGYENLMTDMVEKPAFVHRLFRFLCDDVLSPYIDTMRKDVGIPELLLDGRDAWASPPLISLEMMDEYVVAYSERLSRNLSGNLITRGNWGDAHCRDPERFFSQKLRCSPSVLSVLDPDLYELGPDRVKKYALEHDVPLTAGFDATLLRNGPIDAILDRIYHYIDKLGGGGKCMIHLNQIAAETPPQHVHAAVAACHVFGRLPAEAGLNNIEVEIAQRESFPDFMRRKKSIISGNPFL